MNIRMIQTNNSNVKLANVIFSIQHYLKLADGVGQSITVTKIDPEVDKVTSTHRTDIENQKLVKHYLGNALALTEDIKKHGHDSLMKMAVQDLQKNLEANQIEQSVKSLDYVKALALNKDLANQDMTKLDVATDNNQFLHSLLSNLADIKTDSNSESLNELISQIKTQIENNSEI